MKPKMPKVGEFVRGIGTLLEIKAPKPQPPPPDDYIFEENHWRVEGRRNGRVLFQLSTLNDFYGLESGKKSAIEEAMEHCTKERIGPDSEIELVVVQERHRYRKRQTTKENFYARDYIDFDVFYPGSSYGLENPPEVVVWSSKQPSSPGGEP